MISALQKLPVAEEDLAEMEALESVVGKMRDAFDWLEVDAKRTKNALADLEFDMRRSI